MLLQTQQVQEELQAINYFLHQPRLLPAKCITDVEMVVSKFRAATATAACCFMLCVVVSPFLVRIVHISFLLFFAVWCFVPLACLCDLLQRKAPGKSFATDYPIAFSILRQGEGISLCPTTGCFPASQAFLRSLRHPILVNSVSAIMTCELIFPL